MMEEENETDFEVEEKEEEGVLADITSQFGMTKVQINNALQAGKKGNLRDKLIKAAGEM